MSEEYGDFPGIRTIDTSRPEAVSVGPTHEFVHLDDIDGLDCTKQYHLYVYKDEARGDELAETITDFREEFILATGIVWPSWMRDEMPLETDALLALEWAIAFGGELTPDLLESVQDELRNEEAS